MNLQFNFPDTLTVPNNQHEGNQEILDSNREHFSGQAKIVLDLLMDGKTVTSLKMIEYGIIDTRARIFTLRSKGLLITEEKVEKGKGAKCWSMEPKQVQYNLNLITQTK